MRIVRLKLSKEVKEALGHISREFRIRDEGFVQDVYALIRFNGNNLPTQKRVNEMAKFAKSKTKTNSFDTIGISLLMNKRRTVLDKLIKLKYFHAVISCYDPIAASHRILTHLQLLYKKKQESQCLTCEFLSKCLFGKQYGSNMSNIKYVRDEEYATKVHEDCPYRPEIETTNQMVNAINTLKSVVEASEADQALMEATAEKNREGVTKLDSVDGELDTDQMPQIEAEDDLDEDTFFDPDENDTDREAQSSIDNNSASKTGIYDGKHNARQICSITESFVSNVSKSQLAIHEIGRKLAMEMTSQSKGKFKPVRHLDKEQQTKQIESVSDVSKISPSQHGLPEELFNKRQEGLELMRVEHLEQTEKRPLVYFLVDNSGSMCSQMGNYNVHNLFTRGALAMSFSLALVRRVKDDGGIAYLRFFGGAPGTLYSARNATEYLALENYITTADFDDGGTDIQRAIKVAVKDIKDAQDADMKKSEVFLISDCADYFDSAAVVKLMEEVPLNVLDVSGSRNSFGSADAQNALKSISTKYFKVDEKKVTITELVQELL